MAERVALYALSFFAGLALTASLAVHVATFSADPPGRGYPGETALELGVFALVMPAATLFAIGLRRSRKNPLSAAPLAYVPLWLAVPMALLALYAIFLTFEATALRQEGVPARQGDGFVLHRGGEVVRTLTAEEFARAEASLIRVRTAQCAAFYLAALTMTVGCLRMLPHPNESEKAPELTPAVEPASPESAAPLADRPAGKSRPAWRV